jgi:hypothetical protein
MALEKVEVVDLIEVLENGLKFHVDIEYSASYSTNKIKGAVKQDNKQ